MTEKLKNPFKINELVTVVNSLVDGEGGANISLSNLTSQGQNIANWSTNVTNCITEIPQDIKLEFTGSTMTLKAGSKVTFGDGTSITITVDKNTPFTITSADKYMLSYTKYSNNLTYNRINTQTASGTETPTSGYWMYYNITDKKVYDINNGVNVGELSLPLCIFSSDTSSITSIDQVFNGFGYIGSTVFVLPGVKGLIPNGRNKDGTLKNIEFTTSSVLTSTQAFTGWNGKWSLYLNTSIGQYHPTELEYISDTKPTGVYTTTAYWYSPSDNKLYFTQDTGATWTQSDELHCVDYTENSSKITSITPKTAFHAVDYNDFADLKDNVDTINSNAVHKTGNETISGTKTFTNHIEQQVDVIRGQTPSRNIFNHINFCDKNNNWLAGLEYSLLTDKSSFISLIISDSVGDTTNVKGNIQLGVFSDGSVYTAAPTPHISSNGTNIATTAFVNTKFQVVSTLPANPDSNVYYFIPE